MKRRSSLVLGKLRGLTRRTLGYATMATETSLAAIGVSRPSVLLLLGHMRSGSTLMLHLLLTNPEVSALGERGVAYASSADLARLAIATRMAHRGPFRRLRYVVDQVNHNELTPNDSLLQDPRVRALFLLRRPEAAVASILELYRVYYPQPWSVCRAVDYYVERLEGLIRLSDILRGPTRAALISFETLLELPAETLEALRLFLGLRHGFSQTYRTYSFTRGWGDPGPNIAAGRIVRHRAAGRVDLPMAELQRAKQAYVRCLGALAQFALLPIPLGR